MKSRSEPSGTTLIESLSPSRAASSAAIGTEETPSLTLMMLRWLNDVFIWWQIPCICRLFPSAQICPLAESTDTLGAALSIPAASRSIGIDPQTAAQAQMKDIPKMLPNKDRKCNGRDGKRGGEHPLPIARKTTRENRQRLHFGWETGSEVK